jgi:hypothetical protein
LSGLRRWNDGEGAALTRTGELLDQCAKIRRLKWIEPTATVFRRVAPRIVRAHERTHRFAIAEINPGHGDDFVDDRRQFASGFSALDLRLPGRDVEIVDILLEHCHETDVALAGVLKLI